MTKQELFMGVDPGVHLAYVVVDAAGRTLTAGLQAFPASQGSLRCYYVAREVRNAILSCHVKPLPERIHVGIEVEGTAAPYRRHKTPKRRAAAMRVLAAHNQIVGAALAGAGLAGHVHTGVKVHALAPSNVSKTERELAAKAAGYHGGAVRRRSTASEVPERLHHHLFDAWYIADTLRRKVRIEGA